MEQDHRSAYLFNLNTNSKHLIGDNILKLKHFKAYKVKNTYSFCALDTVNDVFVNGVKLTKCNLEDGDLIRSQSESYIFYSENSKVNIEFLQSECPIWSNQLRKLPDIAQSSFPVLILGDSGTGKELIAQSCHQLSNRKNAPFISVNCSALNESLIESELFGHKKGSFTGASDDRKGAFEAARGGTLFLDEIGDLPLSLQPKLLRALDNREVKPIGSDKIVTTDVRIIAATHHKLEESIKTQKFRTDLFYRLNILRVSPPPLKDRLEDFERLIYFFCRKYKVSFSFSAIQELKKYSWPGNIRELKNLVARASATISSKKIGLEELPLVLITKGNQYGATHSVKKKSGLPIINEIEKNLIIEALLETNGNQRKTAFQLGLPKSTLHDRIKRYKINIPTLIKEEKSKNYI